ncbi:TPA: hypothetical protein ACMDXF_004499 [Vibrio parahaemolyticus]|uniref:hypothetical protein n=1 Tax=Vibrio harveyi group TaxID=717610 RepID=UPI000940DFF5|nr:MULTISPECIES: hypothetical protein [Vibrio harveyi group]MBE3933216.1 hypothetical protein [Vibrio parahaemolyticus]MBE4044179.1 hypothetical protein [Vibrio parahaemolyticus]MCG6440984.1 hypothetical protein [Vibrio parahaemolyticus]MCG6454917.1 hypothetical protein [Vibrio parahaemolyticus]OKQ15921.1 hypothetical protein H058_20440 [Vibrio antiquarius]
MSFNSNPNSSGSATSEDLDVAKLNAGFIGKLFGTGQNGPVNIAGICVVLGLLTGAIITAGMLFTGKQNSYEIWQYVSPIVTGALGFIFGKGNST